MDRRPGSLMLSLSGMGFPLTQLAIARLGRRGAFIVEGVAVGLLARDATMIASGVPRRLQPLPGLLLRLELVAAAAAALLGLRPAFGRTEVATAGWRTTDRLEVARRVAVGALFGLHSWRYRIYLTPGHGRRATDG